MRILNCEEISLYKNTIRFLPIKSFFECLSHLFSPLLDLNTFVGDCYVARHNGDVTGADAAAILRKAEGTHRILIAGPATVTAEAADVFANSGICLLGNESQTVGPEDAPMQVHKTLLEKDIALLEGVVLTAVPEGRYFLSAAPLCLAGADGAPCRAYLLQK